MDKETLSNYGWIIVVILIGSIMLMLATPFGKYLTANIHSPVKDTVDNAEFYKDKNKDIDDNAKNKISINYMLDGGQFNGSHTNFLIAGSQFHLPTNVTKDNYEFIGWSLSQPNDVESSIITELDPNSPFVQGQDSITVYANWAPSMFVITYNTNGGQFRDINGVSYHYNYRVPINLPTPHVNGIIRKDGYRFIGWYDSNTSLPFTYTQDQTGDLNLYAVWEKGEELQDNYPLNPIPDGGLYTKSNGLCLTSGQEFPESPSAGDTYEYGDYIYKYNQYYNGSSWSKSTSQNGWGVRVKNTSKTTYGEIISEIAGQPVNTMSYTFNRCSFLTTAPTIPNSVTDMSYTFKNCTSLTTAPAIPNSVKNMLCTFRGCSKLTTVPTIPSSVTNMNGTFSGCTSITTAPAIPNSVINMQGTFRDCTSLTTATTIPNSVTSMDQTFYGCTSLTTAPTIPNGVTDMRCTFSDCTSLITAPAIPNSVTNMFGTFMECKSLISAPILPQNVTDISQLFYGCTSLKTYAGSTDSDGNFLNYKIPNNVTNMRFTFSFCTSLITAPTIPSSVTNISYTFHGCRSLTGTIEINANPINYDNCFYNTVKPIQIYGQSTVLEGIAETGNKGNVTVDRT